MSYLPIEDHGVIGDLYSCALVGIDGRIDWCCLPYFDSPSVFAGILDSEIGGSFCLKAEKCIKRNQRYLPDSAVLLTRSYTEYGVGQIEDFMPVATPGQKRVGRIVRRVSCVRGEARYQIDCRPAFNFARSSHKIQVVEGGVLFQMEEGQVFALHSPVSLDVQPPSVTGTFTVKEGQCLSFVFLSLPEEASSDADAFRFVGQVNHAFEETLNYWQKWLARCSYRGRWSEMVFRSALTLKLLTFKPTGAIVAAPTMGLPEAVGGDRNWDYRYTWIRDASFTLYALMRIGYTEEAEQFMGWVEARCAEIDIGSATPLHLMYGISGEHQLTETHLDHLEGYRGSRPVRLGNAAFGQLQLDIYGELMDSVYLYNKYGSAVSYDFWRNVRNLIDWVADNWQQPDEGIWETRGGKQDFVYSRLMCWVALDRASRLSSKYSMPGDRIKWMSERDKIYDEIMCNGWNEKRRAFRHHYGSETLDAANLLMPLVKFISPTDPRMISTIDATLEVLTTDSLVYRYDPAVSPDGLSGKEGTFCMCTFWLVECLTRAGRLNEARLIFEKMLGYANHVGLYAEEIGNHGEALGNFPQAFTHMALISAGYNLDRALTGNPGAL